MEPLTYAEFRIDPDFDKDIRLMYKSRDEVHIGMCVGYFRNKRTAQNLCDYLNALIEGKVKPPKNWRK